MAAGKRRYEPVDIGRPRSDNRQLQPRGPSLGAGGQRRPPFRARHAGSAAPRCTGRGLLGGEPQLGGPQLGQLPAPCSRARASGGSLRMASTGAIPAAGVPARTPRRMHQLGADQMIVVKHQRHLVPIRAGRQFIDQRGDQPFVRRRRGGAEQRPHPFTDPGLAWSSAATACRQNLAGSCRRCPATTMPPAAGRAPSRPADRLAVPRRGEDQHQPPCQGLIEAFRAAGGVRDPGAAWACAAW